ncbi:WD40 repeat-like protein, partial [Clavulina sp. PMI_390]
PLDGEEGELVEDEASTSTTRSTSPSAPEPKRDFISDLPPELGLYIFLLLDLPSIVSASAVARYWNALSRDSHVWRDLFYSQPHYYINPARARRAELAALAGASSDAATMNGKVPMELTLALDWQEIFRSRWELDRRWEGKGSADPRITHFIGHGDSVYCVEYDHQHIISGSRDRTIRIWATPSTHSASGHDGSVLCLKFDSATGFMVSGSSDCRILVWDLNELGRDRSEGGSGAVMTPKATLRGHTMGVLDLKFDDEWIVSCAKDTTVRLWSRSTLEQEHVFAGHSGPVNAIDMSRATKRIISASGDGTLILWDILTRTAVRTFTGHTRGLACVSNSSSRKAPDELIISGSNDKTIRIWSARTGECLYVQQEEGVGHADLVRALAYDQSTGRLVSASYDQTSIVWDLERVVRGVRQLKGYHSSHIFDVKFDLSRIVSTSHDRTIVVVDFAADL